MNFSEEVESVDVPVAEDAMDTASSETMAPDTSVSSDDLEIKTEDAFIITDTYVPAIGAEDIVLSVQPLEAEEKPTRLDNILTLSLVAALVLAILAVVLRKIRSDKKPQAVAVEEIPATPAAEAPGSAGGVKLYDTDPKTAAMVMAIVADKLQKPLNELRFVSIKEVK